MRSLDYVRQREGDWRLWFFPRGWSMDLWQSVREQIEKTARARHPVTIKMHFTGVGMDEVFYLKVFHRSVGLAALKDGFRDSKAVRSLKQGIALGKLGFCVPFAVAAGEERKCRVLKRAFILTRAIPGKPLPLFLQDFSVGSDKRISFREKRKQLKRLALAIRSFHQLGFAHGDLIPANLLVSQDGPDEQRFFFMDNDRTRRYPLWFPQWLWKRNLVQLNRFPLPGITLQDRVRFLKYYLWIRSWSGKQRELLRWLEIKTRQRRRECDAIDSTVRFRELMRWHGQVFDNEGSNRD